MSKDKSELVIVYYNSDEEEIALENIIAYNDIELGKKLEEFVSKHDIETFLVPPMDLSLLSDFQAVVIKGSVVEPTIKKTVEVIF